MKESEIVEALKKSRRIIHKWKDGSFMCMYMLRDINSLIGSYRAKERNRLRKTEIDRLSEG